jgi:hypothetical protein
MSKADMLQTIFVLVWGILCLVLIKQAFVRSGVPSNIQERNATGVASVTSRVPSNIKQMYYINLDHRQDRNTFMLEHVVPRFQQKGIPYARVSARRGNGLGCDAGKDQSAQCKGIVGVLKSNLYILEKLPIVNNTLILEDDWSIKSIDALNKAVDVVPKDWDIIRFDCWGKYPTSFAPTDMNNVFRTAHVTLPPAGWFCGGAHAMLIRPSSVPILKKIWSKTPYNDIDCRLTSKDIKSYCVNQKIMKIGKSLGTDIPKIKFAQSLGTDIREPFSVRLTMFSLVVVWLVS